MSGFASVHARCVACLVLVFPLGVLAQSAEVLSAAAGTAAHDEELSEVVVYGRGEELIGKAGAASEGVVGGADLSVRPLLRVAELLEAVPGLIAAQHSGSGKANQYFLRGMNLDHGTDFSSYIDDVPWNLRTQGHGQGYLDVNGLIPEIVDRIEYRKGPYRADVGDFSLAGSAALTSIDRLKHPFVAIEAGQGGWERIAAGESRDVGAGTLTALGQWKTYDGPWQLREDLRSYAAWGKYSRPTGYGTFNATLSAYQADWDPTEQSPDRAVGTAVCPTVFCSLDKTATGHTDRLIASVQTIGSDWHAAAFMQYYNWHMLSDPTYDYQIRQFDRRQIYGGHVQRQLVMGENLTFIAGADARYDDIKQVGVDHTEAGVFAAPISNNGVREGSAAVFAESTWKPFASLRVTGGLRGDYYSFDVSAKNELSVAGRETSTKVSPKAGLAWVAGPHVELYANWGRGFHSNDARGVVNKDASVPGLVAGTGYEGGARYEFGNFRLSATYWWLNIGSELVFVGDSNAVEPKAGGRRHGYELTAFWRPVEWLAIDAVFTGSHASYEEAQDDGGYHIEGSVESAGEIGLSAINGPWEFSARLRYLGPYPLVPNNSERAASESLLNVRAARKFMHLTLYGELLNVFDSRAKDIEYFYASHVDGVDPPGVEVEGRLSRPAEPRTLRAGFKYEF